MKIIIPMAGYGTRLRPHTWSKPKPLVSVAGKPVLGHVLDMFDTIPDVDEIVFIVGYLGEQVEEYMSVAYPDVRAQFITQDELLGQSHALWLAREHLVGPICMVFVDTLIEADLSGLSEETADAIAWVKQVDDPRRFGVTELDPQGTVLRLVEKPDDALNNLALTGFYYFKEAERLAQAIGAQLEGGNQLGGEFYLADAINIMISRGLSMRVETVTVWKDCGTPEDLLETNRYLLDHGRGNSTDISPRDGLLIVPPVYIDPSATISYAVVGPYASIGADCVVQHSIVRDSVLENGARIEGAFLDGSLIGRGAWVTRQPTKVNLGDQSSLETG